MHSRTRRYPPGDIRDRGGLGAFTSKPIEGHQMDRPIAVIPARYSAARFPGKPLAMLCGKPMVQHVWERCQESEAFARVVVATDDVRIAKVVAGFSGEAVLTSPHCASGTDRVAEVAR